MEIAVFAENKVHKSKTSLCIQVYKRWKKKEWTHADTKE
jgi:hypothetical protein